MEAIRAKSVEIRSRKVELKQIEELGARLEERLILDNRYTEHSTVGLPSYFLNPIISHASFSPPLPPIIL